MISSSVASRDTAIDDEKREESKGEGARGHRVESRGARVLQPSFSREPSTAAQAVRSFFFSWRTSTNNASGAKEKTGDEDGGAASDDAGFE